MNSDKNHQNKLVIARERTRSSHRSGIGPGEKRYRSNPIEVALFGVVAMVVINSVYHLLYDHPSFNTPILTQMHSNPLSEGRTLASLHDTQRSDMNLEISCNTMSLQETTAGKLRLKGPICGSGTYQLPDHLVKATITNTANQFHATVFTDLNSGLFSTDYIPLNTGENTIRFEFSYPEGKVVNHEILIKRN
jgi:hypothetical protein